MLLPNLNALYFTLKYAPRTKKIFSPFFHRLYLPLVGCSSLQQTLNSAHLEDTETEE